MKQGYASISVIIPVYNGEAFLGEAIASVQRQTLAPMEILVVDDGSTDDSAAVACKAGGNVRCLRQANAGPAAARNLGLQQARGELIAFLDADDLWPKDKLANQMARLAKTTSAGIALGPIRCLKPFDADCSVPAFAPFGMAWSWCLLGAALIRRSVFDRAGIFDPSLRYGEDLDWFLRALDTGTQVASIEQVSLFYRIHGHNMTRGLPHTEFGLPRLLKRHLDRQRSASTGKPLSSKPAGDSGPSGGK